MRKFMMGQKLYLSAVICMACLFNIPVGVKISQAEELAIPIFKVTLQSIFLDGELTEEIVFKESASPEEVMQQYADWELVKQTDKELVFQKRINDISPLLKTNGYFGLTEDGVLSIFNGRPSDSDVIHSFFQIDVDMLEVKKQQELGDGIRVNDKDQFQAVLETFKPYRQP
ncbi:BofC C-terminal domain-containing protein [Bacillus sp. AGMB 02131]|uniref:BofC C-terminal domain-containing protein n=1 Tax=Peribacillus faecalis TaxID=2772559 RepID=A0A927HAW2_9BACI|nr:BofC C-terminal domain-containing protein [Peribacillus faecalis]MBD3107856.1 BofC C-terminal domain-containing protein [Peribacillus faecalis]